MKKSLAVIITTLSLIFSSCGKVRFKGNVNGEQITLRYTDLFETYCGFKPDSVLIVKDPIAKKETTYVDDNLNGEIGDNNCEFVRIIENNKKTIYWNNRITIDNITYPSIGLPDGAERKIMDASRQELIKYNEKYKNYLNVIYERIR